MLYRLCELLVHSLIEHPDACTIDRIETERVDIFFLHVGKDDRGRILGKGGRRFGGLRRFLEAAGAVIDREVVLEISE